MTDQKYKDLMNGGWSYPKKESTDPEEVKKVVDKYLTDNKIDSETIDKKITDGVSKIVADAPEDFDTLKEMSDWISEHEDSAAAMNSAILDNKSSIETLQTSKANTTDINAIKITTESVGKVVSEIDSSMSDYGLNNVFDGELEQGGIDSGTKVVKDNYIITKNKIYCSPYDFIKSKGDNLESSYACFYKSNGTYIGGLNALDGCTAPSDSAYCYVEFTRSGITPSTAGHIGVYVNNQIDVVNEELDSRLYMKSYALTGGNTSRYIRFSGLVRTRHPVALLILAGQVGISDIITIEFSGNGEIEEVSTKTPLISKNGTDLGVKLGPDNGTITIPQVYEDWGSHRLITLEKNLSFSYT